MPVAASDETRGVIRHLQLVVAAEPLGTDWLIRDAAVRPCHEGVTRCYIESESWQHLGRFI